jgi:hypothetical protein
MLVHVDGLLNRIKFRLSINGEGEGLCDDQGKVIVVVYLSAAVPLTIESLCFLKWIDGRGLQQSYCLEDYVSAKWETFCLKLGFSDNDIKSLDKKYLLDSTLCWRAVMQKWLDGGGNKAYRMEWGGVYQLLADCGYSNRAAELEAAITKPIKNPVMYRGVVNPNRHVPIPVVPKPAVPKPVVPPRKTDMKTRFVEMLCFVARFFSNHAKFWLMLGAVAPGFALLIRYLLRISRSC